MNKINVVELLKDCPTGMELDCTIYNGKVCFEGIDNNTPLYPIKISINLVNIEHLDSWGQYTTRDCAKCIIFPKGKTTWEGFVPPCQFKDGDILATDLGSVFYLNTRLNTSEYYGCYVGIGGDGSFHICEPFAYKECCGFATKEERTRLFDAIKENGYEWNEKTKTLKKLVEPKFKVGDWVVNKFGDVWHIDSFNSENYQVSNGDKYCYFLIEEQDKMHLWTIQDAKDGDVLFHSDSASNGIFIFKEIVQRGTSQKVICYCDYDSEDGFCLGENHTCCWTDSKILYPATKKRCDLLFKKIKEAGYKWNTETKTLDKLPKFKVGDKIKRKGDTRLTTIKDIRDNCYIITIPDYFDNAYITDTLLFSNQNEYELVTNKFDITTLQPFESRVLIRDHKGAKWRPAIWGCYDNEKHIPYPYVVVGGLAFARCIPYEGNEYLCGTTDDCNDFYKTWE